MKKFVVLLLALAMIPSIQSCKKKEEPKPTAEEIITKDDWRHVKTESYDTSGNLVNTQTLNHKVVFTVSGDYYYYDDSGDISDYGTWELLDDDTKILITPHSGGNNFTFDIEKLSENEFNFSITGSTGKHIYYHTR